MIDPFGRRVSYLRVSVTDRCDLRCVYCMAEDMTFLPKAEVLTLEELDRLCAAFIDLGVEKIRLTGGEPLVRRNVMSLVESLGARLGEGGLRELTLTTNGTQLGKHAEALARAGCAASTSRSTRWTPPASAPRPAGATSPRCWTASSPPRPPGCTSRSTPWRSAASTRTSSTACSAWCGEHGFDLCLIETMPLGEIADDRADQYLPLSLVEAAAGPALDPVRLGLRHRRPGALLRRRRDRRAARASSRR
jgi:cyclic pyranopterin phosphate synthase